MAVAQLDQLLHAARRVVEGESLHPRVLGEKTPALRQGHRMRKDAVDIVDRRARRWRSGCGGCAAASRAPLSRRAPAAGRSAPDTEPARLFSMGMTAASTSPFDERRKDVGGKREGNDSAPRIQLHRCFVAERAGFSLDRNLHSGARLSCARNVAGRARASRRAHAFSHHTTGLTAGFAEIPTGRHRDSAPQPQIGGHKAEKDHGDDAIHGEECGIQAPQVARRNDGSVHRPAAGRRPPCPASRRD